MSERARERVSVREGESDGRERGERRVPDGHEGDEEGEGFVGVRSRAKKGGFGVESKWFDVEVREQKGKEQVLIVERKGGISSWVRLGPNSIGSFIDGLEACIGNAGTGIWEKQWKDSGRSFLMVRSQNKGGLFIRLGVTDMGNKRFSIFIPKGNGSKNGWVLMAGLLRRLGCYDRETRLQAKGVTPLRSLMGKSYAEAVVYSEEKAIAVARVELGKRDLSRSMGKMAHCLVGSWDTSFEVGEDLRDWGTKLAKLWCLKGNLGIAKMERGKALLEFGILAEAEKALKIGGFSCLGSPLNLQKWRPECGCLQEGNKRSEAWVRVLGLPVSMWERDTLKRIGDACGGFIDVDHQTEMLEDLQWARILVKIKQERLPNEMEIRTEDHRYVLSLWWELRPTVRKVREEKGKGILVSDGEDGGEGYARAGGRVRGLVGGSSLEVRLQTDDGTRGQSSGMGLTAGTDSDLVSDGPHELCGLAKQWAVGPHEVFDSALPCDSGLIHIGLPSDAGRAAKKKSIGGDGLGSQGRGSPQPWSCLTVKNGLWRPSNEEQRVVKNSMTDDALMEEALRYGTAPNYYGPLVCVPPFPPSYSYFSGRTPLGECYDRSGVGLDASQRVILDRRMGERTFAAMKPMDRWEMGEDNNGALGACGQDLCLVGETVPEIRDWREASWEESELARFSQFLGFPTAGLEKEILDFMVKIRERREKVHRKSLLENSKFERELKRLECTINYDGGRKQKGIVQGRGGQSPDDL
ncbi:hypothetical protein CK203_072706 [Vitis vinifera]|uniref:DUF4283 domain-containing protein n=1 Tax=Vitis vinifera TaxID=29760 RepID=A0A438EZ25_VITVI|nr:hypothetical protein CK203_072706 [Vitis vinifera]